MKKGVIAPIIETIHYSLRELLLEDANALFPIMSDENTMKFITPHPVKTLKEMESTVNTMRERRKSNQEVAWVIEDKSIGNVIGIFRYHKWSQWHKKAEIGVVIRKEYQNKGVMGEILPKMLYHGYINMNLNRIVGDIFEGNKASEKLLINHGFHKDGQLRETDFDGVNYHDTIVYSLLKREYKEINKEI
ncbi:GNAT family N-acetyltransferase [Rossellomorea sp. BNER]|uniref:GNAT family N-acetyltransferase n=1 Tax=Rossellomorea sp. BNER TaxID=2962031 RepID=UPI003AF1F759|nr:GNAT family N-acetyltransferase [Rossellomorea sp. BNER]